MNRYRAKLNETPGTGERPNANYCWDYDRGFEHLFELHPQLADAFCGRLVDSWVPHSNAITTTGEARS